MILIVVLLYTLAYATQELRSSSLTALSSVIMTFISIILAHNFKWGGVCSNQLMITNYAVVWVDWLSSWPTMLFFNVRMNEMTSLNIMSWLSSIFLFIGLILLFLIDTSERKFISFWLVALAAVSYSPVLMLCICLKPSATISSYDLKYTTNRIQLSLMLIFSILMVPATHVVASFYCLPSAVTVQIFVVISFVSKSVFAAACLNVSMIFDSKPHRKKTNAAISVLIVDDSETCRKFVENHLKMISFGISTVKVAFDSAENGKVAFEMFLKDPSKYGLILMDLSMPILGGIAATKALRENGFRDFIVGMTAASIKLEVEEFENAGTDAVLYKPVGFSVLRNIVEFVADHQSYGLDKNIRRELVLSAIRDVGRPFLPLPYQRGNGPTLNSAESSYHK
jgi:CheY-like chemotaxis protein